MAIGENGNNGGTRENRDTTYYSRFRTSRTKDGLGLAVRYSGGLMIVEINKTDEDASFKTSPVEAIYLSPTKARILAMQLKAFMDYRAGDDIDRNKAFGVNAGMNEKITYIAFSTDEDKIIYLTIGKFDGTGTITESATYQFAKEYNYGLEWNNLEANDLSKVFFDEVEINTLIQAFDDFSRSCTGALGYGTLDLNRYEAGRTNGKFDQIFDKLGIERPVYNNRRSGGGNNNFLSNASSKPASMEDIEDLLV